MEQILVKADKRSELGKGGARSLRRMGLLPSIVYSGGDSTPIKIGAKEMTKLILSGVGQHALITIELNEDGSKVSEHPVLIKDYQRDPVSEELLHVDFIQVSLEETIKITVSLHISKPPIGVKMGGILHHRLREVEVECLPKQIPDKFEIDASSVQIGESFRVSDLPVQEDITIMNDLSQVILSVSAPVVEEAAPAEAGAEEPAEPELVKGKGKEGEEKPTKEEK